MSLIQITKHFLHYFTVQTFGQHNHHRWRVLFWFASCITFSAILIRLSLPESELFLRKQQEKKELNAKLKFNENGAQVPQNSKTWIFIQEIGRMLKLHWALCIYAVLLMSGFNFLSHGSQGGWFALSFDFRFGVLYELVLNVDSEQICTPLIYR